MIGKFARLFAMLEYWGLTPSPYTHFVPSASDLRVARARELQQAGAQGGLGVQGPVQRGRGGVSQETVPPAGEWLGLPFEPTYVKLVRWLVAGFVRVVAESVYCTGFLAAFVSWKLGRCCPLAGRCVRYR